MQPMTIGSFPAINLGVTLKGNDCIIKRERYNATPSMVPPLKFKPPRGST
jgi:hypothetical protein